MSNQLQKIEIAQNSIILTETAKALHDTRISDCHDKQIAEALLGIYFMVGLREQHYPTEIEDRMLFGYIRENYSHKTVSELRLAFKLAIKGELDLKAEDVKVYDKFSIAYLTQIMEAYRKYLLKVNAEIKLPEPEQKLLPCEPMTDDDYLDMAKSVFRANWRLIPVQAYTILTKSGAIKLNEQQRNQVKTKILTLLAQEERSDPKLYDGTTKEELCQKWCKKWVVAEYLHSQQ